MPVGPKFFDMLAVLDRHEVDFIVVGGIAAILHGAPIMTVDLDVLYEVTSDNVTRLLGALGELKARYRDPAGRELEPDTTKLTTLRMSLLRTDLGPLDVLATIGQAKTYADLLGRSNEIEIEGLRLKVLDLEAIIESKEHADRPKDRATLPFLRELLEIKNSQLG